MYAKHPYSLTSCIEQGVGQDGLIGSFPTQWFQDSLKCLSQKEMRNSIVSFTVRQETPCLLYNCVRLQDVIKEMAVCRTLERKKFLDSKAQPLFLPCLLACFLRYQVKRKASEDRQQLCIWRHRAVSKRLRWRLNTHLQKLIPLFSK